MICKVCRRQPAKYGGGGRCSRCYTWYYRHGVERPMDAMPVRSERGRGWIKCAACGDPIAEHGSPPCPRFATR